MGKETYRKQKLGIRNGLQGKNGAFFFLHNCALFLHNSCCRNKTEKEVCSLKSQIKSNRSSKGRDNYIGMIEESKMKIKQATTVTVEKSAANVYGS